MTTMSCNISKNRGVCSIESPLFSSLSGRSAAQILVKSTFFKGLTNKSNPDTINPLLTNNQRTTI
jgi:hypothetical protein